MSTQASSASMEGYVKIPISLIKYLQHETLTALESNLLLYIIERSLNFGGYDLRKWVEISPSKYSAEYGVHRVSVSKALTRIAGLEIVECHKKIRNDNVEVRKFRVADFDIIARKTIQILPKIENENENKKNLAVAFTLQRGTDFDVDNFDQNVNSDKGGCSDALYGHVAMRSTAMYRCALRPCSDALYGHKEIDVKFHGVANSQECINKLNNFFKNISRFENSYVELMINFFKTKREKRNFQILIRNLISDYSLFHVWVGVIYHLQDKTLYYGDYEALKRIIKNNENEIEENWEKLILHINNLFFELSKYQTKCESTLKNFDEHSLLFLNEMKLDQRSSLLYFYEGIDDDVINAFKVSTGDVDSFQKKIIKNLNLYFKSKILGESELIYDQLLSAN